jgi:hypothetical protein
MTYIAMPPSALASLPQATAAAPPAAETS